ncbi:MAG TPA: conjugal transfer protein TraR [Micromonosporaceae bacterium]|nr:conjugal transfer protein TraR [Micromonosporaceae bacterium]HCU48239.1 conjugal transfer protein TraR [Micromonosporaceae bacterium]
MHDPAQPLRATLEDHLQRHTARLGELTSCSRRPDRGGYDTDTLAALFASSHQAVSDTALALQRMTAGSYGICERCRTAIPIERLQAIPHARCCVSCQRIRPS